MKERVLQFIAYLGVTTAEFERSCGLANGAVSRMGFNTRQSTLDKLSHRYHTLSISWLRTGEGSMLVDQPAQPSVSVSPNSQSVSSSEVRIRELEQQRAILTRSLDLINRQLEALLSKQQAE